MFSAIYNGLHFWKIIQPQIVPFMIQLFWKISCLDLISSDNIITAFLYVSEEKHNQLYTCRPTDLHSTSSGTKPQF